MNTHFPCKCGIPFDVLPFEFHPKLDTPYHIRWTRLRGEGGEKESVTITGQPSKLPEAYLTPGDWDMREAISGAYFRVHITKPYFQLCTGYRPDNLKYLEKLNEQRSSR